VKFSHFRWKDEARGVMAYIGDKIRFQNGFGAWQPHVYECDLDTLIIVTPPYDAVERSSAKIKD
jgi:hypothetical protein